MDRVLIDTDVLLDFFFDRKPFSDNSAQILALCESKKIIGYVTPVIISNVYYLLRQSANHERVIEKLRELLLITEVLTMDRDVVLEAIRSNFTDFEDALQNYAAVKNAEISTIITRNVKDFKKSSIGVMLPGDYLITKRRS